MKNAILVSTVYQLFAAGNLISCKRMSEVDIFLCNACLLESVDIAEKLVKEKGQVFICSELFEPFRTVFPSNSKLSLVEKIIRWKRIVRKKYDLKPYEVLYASSSCLQNQVLFHAVCKGGDTDLVVYEDGIGSYNNQFKKPHLPASLVYRISFGGYFLFRAKEAYLYRPEMANIPQGVKKKKLPVDPAIVRHFSKGEEEVKKKYEHARILFFDQALLTGDLKKIELQDSCLDLISEFFSAEEILFKPHPRYRGSCHGKYLTAADDLFFEAQFQLLDVENKLLVSIASTACISPKMLSEKEPYVILLYKMLGSDSAGLRIDEEKSIFAKIGSVYDSRKFFTPSSFDELRALLTRIKGEMGAASEKSVEASASISCESSNTGSILSREISQKC